MKNKLKLFVVTLLVFIMTFALTACSSPVVGTWVATEAKYESFTYDIDELESIVGYSISMKIEINADGTFESKETAGDISQNFEGEWTFEDDKLVLDPDDAPSKTTFKYEDGKLVMTAAGVTFYLEKE